jgi:hypothetical protein
MLHVQPGPGLGATVRGFLERGEDWTARRLFAGLTWTF